MNKHDIIYSCVYKKYTNEKIVNYQFYVRPQPSAGRGIGITNEKISLSSQTAPSLTDRLGVRLRRMWGAFSFIILSADARKTFDRPSPTISQHVSPEEESNESD